MKNRNTRSGDIVKKAPSEEARAIRTFRDMLKQQGMNAALVRRFRTIIRKYYKSHGRHSLPWRHTRDAYHILVSEIMLQQTQVDRVLGKYEAFLAAFPDVTSLASAPREAVLSLWQGLGYNRRAVALHRLARIISQDRGNEIPSSVEELERLPGIGRATASAVAAFAYEKPVVFIETNIRRVYLHFFFHGREDVTDRDLLPVIEKTLDRRNPRVWYYALMDYGAMLGRLSVNPNRRSAHYQRQAPFEGSNRQLRGRIVRTMIEMKKCREDRLAEMTGTSPARISAVLQQLCDEGFLTRKGKFFLIRS